MIAADGQSPTDQIAGLIDSGSLSGWDLLIVLIVLILTWIGSRAGRRAAMRLLAKTDAVPYEVAYTCSRAVGYFIVLLGVGIALSVLGAQIQPVLAAVILIAVVAYFALRGVADNFGASLILQMRKPLRVGDWVETDDRWGAVTDMNARSVVLHTSDGKVIHVPNAQLLSDPLVIQPSDAPVRSEIEIRTTELGRIEEIATTAVTLATGADGVMATPAPDLVWVASTPDRMIGRIRIWHKSGASTAVGSHVVRAVGEGLGAAGLAASLTAPPPPPPLVPTPTL
ncbi:mechanosensitive ion channel family protein [Occultella aeris]|uniref:Miniconductance mechanosensitive channel MscM n=1 Tax=Occultella aeris TaxID=2761496 RepID=A0A7M4DQJ2_9MICO|nr:mechanosensitive ion channel domain-containing protein [Occultella aeris]VZO39736.1 Miniconductance mechanosensitive channel MscM precursor [Occultella aeris]